MRVLMVHNFYQIPGGEDSIVREELTMLRQNGIDAELFCVTNDDIKSRLDQVLAALQVVYSLRGRRALARKLAEFAPDIVHIHNFFPLLSPSILDACLDAGVPSVLTLHNFRILCPTALLHADQALRERSLRHSCWWTVPRKVYRNSAAATLALAMMVEFHKRAGTWTRKVDRFIALTDYARRTFVEAGLPAGRIAVKPNCVARPPSFPAVARNGALFVGRLDEQKGVRMLIQAWKGIDYPLTIIGDGPLSDLVGQTDTSQIVWLGRQPRDVVHRNMQAAKFLVLPSTGPEMFPVTVLEAFSNRLPVICSNLDSLRDLVEPDITGLKFLPGDANAMAAMVRYAVSNPLLLDKLGCAAEELYRRQYTPEANFKQLIGIYHGIAQAPRGGRSARFA